VDGLLDFPVEVGVVAPSALDGAQVGLAHTGRLGHCRLSQPQSPPMGSQAHAVHEASMEDR
jgi:hypothetical protein